MACYNMCKGEWPRRACTVRYFSNVFTCKRLALTHLPKKWPLRSENPWVPHAGAELRRRDLQRGTNDIVWCLVLHDLALKAWTV